MKRGQLTAEHVRRALLAFVASERAAASSLGGGMFPSAAESVAWEMAGDADLCAELAERADDIDAIGETWSTPPMERDLAEHAAYLLLLRLPRWAGASRAQSTAVNLAIADPTFRRAFMSRAWDALVQLLQEQRGPAKKGGRQ